MSPQREPEKPSFTPESKLRELLEVGEGRYVEFKSSCDLNELQHCGPVLKASAAFLNTPGDESAWLVVGIVEGDSLDELKKSIRRSVAPESPWDDAAWDRGIRESSIQSGGKALLVVGHPEKFVGKKKAHDALMNQVKQTFSGLPKKRNIRAFRAEFDNKAALPGIDKKVTVTLFEFPPSDELGFARATRDVGNSVFAGTTFYRFMASDSPVPSPVGAPLAELWQKKELLRWRYLSLKTGAAALLVALVATVVFLWPRSLPAPLSSLASGVDVLLRWQDLKQRDVEAMLQIRKAADIRETVQYTTFLNAVREYVQDHLYRVGPLNLGFQDQGTDGGDGGVFFIAYQTKDDQWRIFGRGHVREYEKDDQGNHEAWGVRLETKKAYAVEGFSSQNIIRVDATLTSAVRITASGDPAQPIDVFFFVQLDRGRFWRATGDDRAHFGDDEVTRVFVDPNTLPGVDVPAGLPEAVRIVHIGSLVWTERTDLGQPR